MSFLERFLLPVMCVVITSSVGLVQNADAQLSYHFVQDDEAETILATLEFSTLPATHTEFVSLSFSQAGEELFGFGPTYLGDFDSINSPGGVFLDDGIGGLTAIDAEGSQFTRMEDKDPPESLLPQVSETLAFSLLASTFDDLDEMALNFIDNDGTRQRIIRQGTWTIVPEPNTILLSITGMVWVMSLSRRRRR